MTQISDLKSHIRFILFLIYLQVPRSEFLDLALGA
jgi:hypothetical protein